MLYTDIRGRRQRLTKPQAYYLTDAWRQFDYGWGGYTSTQTVRLLEARGLITVTWDLTDRWRVTGLTQLGEQVNQRWRDLRAKK